jgi:Rad3-related DNA helicase
MCQKANMSEVERKNFLENFDNTSQHLIGFAVLGGIFGEGIDLIGEKLIGVVIVTVGLPMLGHENSLIKDYYEHHLHRGFEYAYRYPGFNKVLQAAGRVIRSEDDKGVVVLIDQRFASSEYKDLYPPDWQHHLVYSDIERLRDEVARFWQKNPCETQQ